MGFRLSFYNIPKKLADKVQTVKSDQELYSYEDDLKNEEMLYDTAYSLMSTFLGENGQYVSRLFDGQDEQRTIQEPHRTCCKEYNGYRKEIQRKV